MADADDVLDNLRMYLKIADNFDKDAAIIAQLTDALRAAVEVLIDTHPLPNIFRQQLESGELERRLERIKGFDSTGRVKAILEARSILTKVKEKSNG